MKTSEVLKQAALINRTTLDEIIYGTECCGVKEISGLGGAYYTKETIFSELCRLLIGDGPGGGPECCIVIITDTEDSANWRFVKKHTKLKTPFLLNPNSGNKIALWAITAADLTRIYNKLPVKTKKEIIRLIELNT